jgi:hypothetical protein
MPSKKRSFAGWIVIRDKTRIPEYQGDWLCSLDVVKVRAYFFPAAVFKVIFSASLELLYGVFLL